MQAGTSHEKAVRPSVKRVDCDETTATCAYILMPHERSFKTRGNDYEFQAVVVVIASFVIFAVLDLRVGGWCS